MKYTDDFIAEVKRLFPNDARINEAAKTGNPILGRYLDDASACSIGATTILNSNSLEELKAQARAILEKIRLYNSYWEQPPAKR